MNESMNEPESKWKYMNMTKKHLSSSSSGSHFFTCTCTPIFVFYEMICRGFICKGELDLSFISLRSLKQTKQGLQKAVWPIAAVTDTTALNPRCSKLPFRPFTGRGKNNKMCLCASKQDFFFQFAHSCDLEYVLPHFSSPFPGSNQSSFWWPCASCCLLAVFFPFFLLFFFLSTKLKTGNHCPFVTRVWMPGPIRKPEPYKRSQSLKQMASAVTWTMCCRPVS